MVTVLIDQSTKLWQQVGSKAFLSCMTLEWWLICLAAMIGPQLTVSIPLWFSASGSVPRGGFPSQINITKIIDWHYCFSHLGPGGVPTLTLHLRYN